MTIKRHSGGSIITVNGRVSCECCDTEIGINFGEPEACDCLTVECYNSETNPSPSQVTVGTTIFTNASPNTDRFSVQGDGSFGLSDTLFLQYPILNNGFQGMVPIVTTPSVMRLHGSAGGDVQVRVFNWSNQSAGSPETFVIPHESLYPCGVCDTPKNGPHPINFFFPLHPLQVLSLTALSFVECFPWWRLRLQRVEDYAP